MFDIQIVQTPCMILIGLVCIYTYIRLGFLLPFLHQQHVCTVVYKACFPHLITNNKNCVQYSSKCPDE